MIVEHSFVTTLDRDRAFSVADELLGTLRFTPESAPASTGPTVAELRAARSDITSALRFDGGPTHRQTTRAWRRGAKRPSGARGQNDLPTRVRMDFDRGRVVVAASVDAPGMDTPKLPRLLAVGVTLALESALCKGAAIPDARAECDRYQTSMASRDRLRTIVIFSLIGLVIASLASLIVFSPFR